MLSRILYLLIIIIISHKNKSFNIDGQYKQSGDFFLFPREALTISWHQTILPLGRPGRTYLPLCPWCSILSPKSSKTEFQIYLNISVIYMYCVIYTFMIYIFCDIYLYLWNIYIYTHTKTWLLTWKIAIFIFNNNFCKSKLLHVYIFWENKNINGIHDIENNFVIIRYFKESDYFMFMRALV